MSVTAKINFPKPSKVSCEFYPRLESELNCNPKKPNYLTGYGLKYCTEFNNHKTKWPESLKLWAEETTYCLQEQITFGEKWMKPCSRIESYAFDSHPRCYEFAGFCKLKQKEKVKVAEVVSISDVRATPGPSVLQILSIAIKCGLGISKLTKLTISYLWAIVFHQSLEWKSKSIILINYIFNGPDIETRSINILTELLQVELPKSSRAQIKSSLVSMKKSSGYCRSKTQASTSFCDKMKPIVSAAGSITLKNNKYQFSLKSLERAYLKYGKTVN